MARVIGYYSHVDAVSFGQCTHFAKASIPFFIWSSMLRGNFTRDVRFRVSRVVDSHHGLCYWLLLLGDAVCFGQCTPFAKASIHLFIWSPMLRDDFTRDVRFSVSRLVDNHDGLCYWQLLPG